MFSLDNFYYVLYTNFLQRENALDIWFDVSDKMPTIDDLYIGVFPTGGWRTMHERSMLVLFYDQEPLIPHMLNSLIDEMVTKPAYMPMIISNKDFKLLANSEYSQFKTDFCKEYKFYDWYYFFHGMAALEWYRDYKYVPKVDNKFTKVFISLNHLVTRDRSYRLNLVANLLERDLIKHGQVSCQLSDTHGSWKTEIFDPSSKLSKDSKKKIYNQFRHLSEPLVIDQDGWRGDFSAKLNLPLQQSALWHLVTETVFYYDKLHLTEKIFKPIVARRPFILVAASGNLGYLKSYGFKTFDRWIDESYDNEPDPDRRIAMIVDQVEKLCQLPPEELELMYQEMQEILDYNFDHFYGEFKSIVVKEMINNFEKCIKQHNVGLIDSEKRREIDHFNLPAVYNRLMQ